MRNLFILLFLFTILNCSAGDPPEPETFDLQDKPVFEQFQYDDNGTTRTYSLLVPWNYDKANNQGRQYPMVVSLHGSGGSNYAPCIVGDNQEMQAYPCFFLSPNSPGGWGSAAAWSRDLMEELIERYSIDRNRIYLMGYSMGGSGSFLYARGYYNEHGGIFAGIVRLSGQSQTSLPSPLSDRTSLWYHIGLNDSATRVDVARNTYAFYQNYWSSHGVEEREVNDRINDKERTTRTLVLNGLEIMKLSEYSQVGHSASMAFHDPEVLGWLFRQSLNRRP